MSERDSNVHGSWRLNSFDIELQDSGGRVQPWGADPNGYLILGSDGRMMTLITARVRDSGNTEEKLAGLIRTMMAYTGRYSIEGDRLITKIDSSWNEAWSGSEQKRFYKLDADALDIISDWMPNPLDSGKSIGRGILSFRRE